MIVFVYVYMLMGRNGFFALIKYRIVSSFSIISCLVLKLLYKHLALFSLRTESDNPDATCELSP